jgi:hypothetical protein
MAATTRPTLAAQLLQASRAGQLRYRGTTSPAGGPLYVIQAPGSVERALTQTDAAAWLEGWNAGHGTAKARRVAGPGAELASLRAVLINPSLQDQCKIAILVTMEEAGLGVVDLAERIGRVRAAVSTALSFEGTLSMPMAEALMQALGRTWSVRPGPPVDAAGDHTGPIAPPGRATREPVGLRAGRGLAVFAEAGLITVTSPMHADKVRRARYFEISRGRQAYKLRVEMVLAWLAGLGDAVDPPLVEHLMPVT